MVSECRGVLLEDGREDLERWEEQERMEEDGEKSVGEGKSGGAKGRGT